MIRESEDELRAIGTKSLWGEAFDSWQAGNLIGTPDQVAEKIQTYIDLGATSFMPWTSDYPETQSIELLAGVAKNFR
jgi:alkanesulfonate monooxygenase SsuD/methylene tetrahydromethanopterin reductase-like flavin-dependent oxidoreductase (luciferase family)